MVRGRTSDMLSKRVVGGGVANRRIGRREAGKPNERGAEAY
jgi:hypothetical protein